MARLITCAELCLRLSLIILGTFLVGITVAQTQISLPRASEIHVVDGNLASLPTKSLLIGTIHVYLEETTLQDVQANLLYSQMEHSGDAGDSEYRICYTLGEGNHKQRLWFIADGEMGGADHYVTSIYASSLVSAEVATDECPQIPAKFQPIGFDNGLWIGATKKNIETALGTAPGTSAGWWGYRYQGKTSIEHRGKPVTYDVSSSFDVKLRRGKVISLRAWQITSS